MTTLTKIKPIFQIFLIIGIVFSLSAGANGSKRASGMGAGAAKDVTVGMRSKSSKGSFNWDKESGRIGFHLKEEGNFSIPNIVLTGYTKKGGGAGSPNGVYEGTVSCQYGGSMSLKNYQISDYNTTKETQHGIAMETIEYNVTGSIIFKNCEDEATDYFDEDGKPDMYEEISSGTMNVSGSQEVGFDVGGGGKGQTNISKMHVQTRNFKYNDEDYNMDITTETDLYEEELDPVSEEGGFYIEVTLDGDIKVSGTINGEEVSESHHFDQQHVKTHFLGNCDINKPKTWKKCTTETE